MNVEELLQNKGVPFKASGQDLVVNCLNPEHEDRNPSMRIDRILGIFRCVSCGFKGNIFKHFGAPEDALSIKRETLKRKVMDLRNDFIGLEMPEDATPFEYPWRNISIETYKKFKAFKTNFEMAGRVVFPITDATGKIVAFHGRDETGTLKKKYYNYPRHCKLPVYPLATPKNGRLILVEGIFDVLNLVDKGIDNVSCIFGVDNFSSEKATLLTFRGVQGVDIILDPDEAGEKGSAKLEKICKEVGLSTRIITLPTGFDPGSLSQDQVTKLKAKLND